MKTKIWKLVLIWIFSALVKIKSQTHQNFEELFLQEDTQNRCQNNFCDGTLANPFDNLAETSSFLANHSPFFPALKISFLSFINDLNDTTMSGVLVPDQNGLFNLDFHSDFILINPQEARSTLRIGTSHLYFSFSNTLEVQNIDFKFSIPSNQNNRNALVLLNGNNTLRFVNCTFGSEVLNNFKLESLIITNNTKNTNVQNVSIFFWNCSFVDSLFINAIININVTGSNIYVEKCVFLQTITKFYIFNIIGKNNNFSLNSCNFYNSFRIISMGNNSFCNLSSSSLINVTFLADSDVLMKFDSSNFLIIQNIYISNMVGFSQNEILSFGINNKIKLLTSQINNLFLTNSSAFIKCGFGNEIEINNTSFNKINVDSSSLVMTSNLSVLNLINSKFILCTISNSNGLIYSQGSANILNRCYFGAFVLNNSQGGLISVNLGQVFNISESIFVYGTGNLLSSLIYVDETSNINFDQIYFYNLSFDLTTIIYFNKNCIITIANFFSSSAFSSLNNETIGGNLMLRNSNILNLTNSSSHHSGSIGIGAIISCDNSNIVFISNFTVFDFQSGQNGIMYFNYNNSIILEFLHVKKVIGSLQIGLIFNKLNSIMIKSSTFIDFNGTVEYGGVFIIIESNVFNLQNCFLSNITSYVGSGLFALNMNQITISNITLHHHKNYNKKFFGGALAFEFFNKINLTKSEFVNCQSPNGGAVVSMDTNNTLFVNSCIFTNITLTGNTHGQGTIIYLYRNTTLNIENSKFLQSSGYYGGGVFCTRDNYISIKSSYFCNLTTRNQSTALGGWLNNIFRVENSTFINCVCTFAGGVFYIDQANDAIFSKILTVNCLSWDSGGIFYFSDSNQIIIQESLFFDSSAYSMGGFIYMNLNNVVKIENITAIWSQSEEFGSFIYFYVLNNVSLSKTKVYNTTIRSDGGLIYIFLQNTLQIQDMEVLNVRSLDAESNGGFIYMNTNNQVFIDNILVANISDVNSGGGFYLNSFNNLTCQNGEFFGISVFFGGIIFYLSENNNVNTSNIIGKNLTSTNFGAIYLSDNNNFSMSYSKINDSKALEYDGGLIYLKNDNRLEFLDSIFLDSYSGGYGGFLFMDTYNQAFVNRSYFLNIRTHSLGELIYCSENNILYGDKIVINNEQYQITTISNLFFFSIQNYVEISRVYIKGQNCQGEGCIIHGDIENVLTVKEFKIDNLYDNSSFIVITLNQNNTLNIESGEIIFREFSNTLSEYLDAYTLNTYKSYNITIKIEFEINSIFSSGGLNKFAMQNDKYDSSNNINSFFVSNENSMDSLKISNMKFQFVFNYILIIGIKTTIVIDRCTFFVRQENDIFFSIVENSSLILANSFIINEYNYRFQTIIANNSKIIISKNFFFNLNGRFDGDSFQINQSFSPVYVKKNIFIHSDNPSSIFNININSSKDIIKFKISRNKFQFCKGANGSILNLKASSNVLTEISQNTFKFNTAENGGVLNLCVFSSLISNNIFYRSTVSFPDSSLISKGGSIYFSDAGDFLNLLMLDNIFWLNKADVGSAIFFDSLDLVLNFSNNSFGNCEALSYGNPFSSKAMNLTFIESNDDEEIRKNILHFTNIVSGLEYPDCLFDVYTLDYFGNLMTRNDEVISLDIIQIFSTPNHLNNTIKYQFVDGIFCFNGPFTRNQPSIPSQFYYHLYFGSQVSPLKLFLTFRNCQIGERISESNECISCEPGTYSFETEFTNTFLCQPCTDADPFICSGGNVLTPKPNFWRLDKFSKNFLKCTRNDVCYQSNSSEQTIYSGACSVGYTGPMCDVCDDDYGKVDKTTCALCSNSNTWSFILLINFKILFKSFYFIYSIYVGFKMISSILGEKISKKSVLAISLLKLLIMHFQILSFIPKIPIKLTNDLFTGVTVVLGFFPEISDVFFFDCYFKRQKTKFDLVYFVLIITPIYIVFIYFITLIIIYRSTQFRKLMRENHYIRLPLLMKMLFYIVIYLSFIDVSQVYLEMFQCVNIGDESNPIFRLYNNLKIDCQADSHLIWVYGFSLPVLALLVESNIAIILKMTVGLKTAHSPTTQKKINFSYGYFFYPYKKTMFFWDFLSLARRSLILFIFLYFYDQIIQRKLFPLLLIYSILAISFALAFRFKPYEHKYGVLNKIEAISLLILVFNFITINLYCSFYFYKTDYQNEITSLTIISLLFLNSLFLVYWSKCYYTYYLKNKFVKIFQKMFSKHYSNVFSQKIKLFLKENLYFCDFENKQMEENEKRKKITMILKTYDQILNFNILSPILNKNNKNDLEIIRLMKTLVKNKNFFKLDFQDFKKLLQNENIIKSYHNESEDNVKLFDINFSITKSGCNFYDYFLKYSIIFKFSQDFAIDNYGMCVLQNETAIEYKFELEVDADDQKIVTLTLELKMFDIEFKGLFFYMKKKQSNYILIFKIPLLVNLFLCYVPMKKISNPCEMMLKFFKLVKLPVTKINTSHDTNKCVSIMKMFFPNLKESSLNWGLKKYSGLISVLAKKNLFLYYIITFNKTDWENCLSVEFYSFENSFEVDELERIIAIILKKFKKALSYSRFKKMDNVI